MLKKISLLLTLGAVSFAYAVPSQVVLVRHADKPHLKEAGIALSPTGYMRAIAFGQYYLNHYGMPDYVLATSPTGVNAFSEKRISSYASIREYQTAAPLLEMLQQRGLSSGDIFLHPYHDYQHSELANYVMTNSAFNGKKLVIVWDSFTMPVLLTELGVKANIPAVSGFDDVYQVNYDAQGRVINYQVLKDQYPVPEVTSWDEIYTAVIKTDSSKSLK